MSTPPFSALSRRSFLALSALGAGALGAGLSGCAFNQPSTGGEGDTKKADLQAWMWSFVGKPTSTYFVPQYEKDHQGVKVSIPELGGDIWTKLTTGFAAGGAGLPDLSLMGVDYIQNYVKTFPQAILDLSSKGADDLKTKYANGVWDAMVAPDGHAYVLPWWCDPSAMTYRSDLFEYAGVSDAADLKSWDDLLEVGRKLKRDKDVSLYSFNYTGSKGTFDSQLWLLLVQLQGSSWYTPDGKIAINNKAGVRAMELLKQGADAGVWASDPGDGTGATALNKKGKLAIRGHVAAYIAITKNEVPSQAGKWRVGAWPSADVGGNRQAVIGSVGLSIPATSPNLAAAYEFVSTFLTDPQISGKIFTAAGTFPALQAAWDDPVFHQADQFYGGQKAVEIVVDGIKKGVSGLYFSSDYQRALAIWGAAQSRVLTQGADPKQALDDAAAQLSRETGVEIASQ
jgi:lactose/L-arabinose transport system substrate-binding protein